MRIIGGAFSGRRLVARPAAATRPTSDRVREALASALEARGLLAGAHVLDLFAGTGALGLEALSRGAHSVVAVDCDPLACACIAENAQSLGVEPQLTVLALDPLASVTRLSARLQRCALTPFTLVFLDPPYALTRPAVNMLDDLRARNQLASRAVAVVEHAAKDPPPLPLGFVQIAAYVYGDTGIGLWEAVAIATET